MTLMGPMERPQLQSLCDGYLHQDFVVEHGSAAGAVSAWLEAANVTAATELSSEWRTFLNATHGMDVAARARALRDVAGGSWEPATAAEFDAVSSLLLNAWRHEGTR